MILKPFPLSLSLVSALFLAFGCEENSPTTPRNLDRVPLGEWGGEQLSLTVRESGAVFERFCARGTLDQPVLLDADGRFEVHGSYVESQGGPSVGHPARYSGSTDGTTATLRVTLTDSERQLGPFRLFFGHAVQVPPCPIV